MQTTWKNSSDRMVKYERAPQNLDNPKNGQTLKRGWALGHLPYWDNLLNAKSIV